MKIDFISSSLIGGGAERVMVLLADHFAMKGHTVSIITFNEGDDYEISQSIKRIRLHQGKFKNHKLRSLDNLFRHYKTKNNRPNVIISFIPETNLISILISKFYTIKIICSEHINYLQKGNYITKFTRNFLYRFSDFITVLTSFDIPFYEKKGAKVVVMPNPCTFEPLGDNSKNREKIILAVGNLNRYHHKGFDNLINLISPVLKNNKDWVLKIIGGGENGLALLKKLVSQNQMEKQIIFTGFRNDVNIMMKESEIFILPSRFEGLPMVLLEAMSQGMACIAYDCKTGPSDMIINNENGLLIEDQNIVAMSNGLELLLSNQNLRKKLSESAIHSLDKYSMKNVGVLWEKLFKSIGEL